MNDERVRRALKEDARVVSGRPRAVEALFDGSCSACGDEIESGDMIFPAGEAGEGWVHEHCYDDWCGE